MEFHWGRHVIVNALLEQFKQTGNRGYSLMEYRLVIIKHVVLNQVAQVCAIPDVRDIRRPSYRNN